MRSFLNEITIGRGYKTCIEKKTKPNTSGVKIHHIFLALISSIDI